MAVGIGPRTLALALACVTACAELDTKQQGAGFERADAPARPEEGSTLTDGQDASARGPGDAASQDAAQSGGQGDAGVPEGDPADAALADAATDPVDARPPEAGGPGPDAGPADGTCAAPFDVNAALTSQRATFQANTAGATQTLSAPSECLGAGLGVSAVPGPDHVYRVVMPFRGELSAELQPALGYASVLYVLGTCLDAGSLRACGKQGVAWDELGVLAQGTELFLYVDSAATSVAGVQLLSEEGQYTLDVRLRAVVGEGEPCGPAARGARCEGDTLACGDEGVCVVPVCGDGERLGAEQCDDGNREDHDGCSGSCVAELCPGATTLELVDGAARVSGDTTGAADVGPEGCGGPAGDDLYAFFLESPQSVQVWVTPDSDWDPLFHLYARACDASARVAGACVDRDGGGADEVGTFALERGWHSLVVEGYDGAEGAYELSVTVQ